MIKYKDSVLCKNCQADIPTEIDLDELNKEDDCPCVHIDVECPKCGEKYIASCWFDFVRGQWCEDGITIKIKPCQK